MASAVLCHNHWRWCSQWVDLSEGDAIPTTVRGYQVHSQHGRSVLCLAASHFGFGNTSDFDPFSAAAIFSQRCAEDYLAGLPWHPQPRDPDDFLCPRGIRWRHGPAWGKKTNWAISSGDVPWMTACRGIIHHDMPKATTPGRMAGLFSVVGEPALSLKMIRAAVSRVESCWIFRSQGR